MVVLKSDIERALDEFDLERRRDEIPGARRCSGKAKMDGLDCL